MEEYLFVDAHAFQLQTARLKHRDGHWYVTKTHCYTQAVTEKQWTKILKKLWNLLFLPFGIKEIFFEVEFTLSAAQINRKK